LISLRSFFTWFLQVFTRSTKESGGLLRMVFKIVSLMKHFCRVWMILLPQIKNKRELPLRTFSNWKNLIAEICPRVFTCVPQLMLRINIPCVRRKRINFYQSNYSLISFNF
jgi:hypothetical protein